MLVYTIGHSTRSWEEVEEMLTQNGVTRLVDVRSFPSSRKFPQWNQENLLDRFPYVWLKDLGGRRHTPAGVVSPNTGWRVKAFRDYADYMGTEGFDRGLKALLAIAQEQIPAIMCSEAVPWRCHRRLITDALLVRGVEVRDILSPTSVREASLTDFAQVDGTVLTYPAPPPGP